MSVLTLLIKYRKKKVSFLYPESYDILFKTNYVSFNETVCWVLIDTLLKVIVSTIKNYTVSPFNLSVGNLSEDRLLKTFVVTLLHLHIDTKYSLGRTVEDLNDQCT